MIIKHHSIQECCTVAVLKPSFETINTGCSAGVHSDWKCLLFLPFVWWLLFVVETWQCILGTVERLSQRHLSWIVDCGLYVIGSSMNGFGSSSSDMDLCLMLSHAEVWHECIYHLTVVFLFTLYYRHFLEHGKSHSKNKWNCFCLLKLQFLPIIYFANLQSSVLCGSMIEGGFRNRYATSSHVFCCSDQSETRGNGYSTYSLQASVQMSWVLSPFNMTSITLYQADIMIDSCHIVMWCYVGGTYDLERPVLWFATMNWFLLLVLFQGMKIV